ncbi:MAG TPA: hypothetical protein VF516_08610 [Kofleriaceae bacterium]
MDKAAARAAVDQVGRIAAAMSAMNSADVAAGVEAMMIAHQTVVAPNDDLGTPFGLLFPYLKFAAPNRGTAVCTAISCSFTGYGFGGGYTVLGITGTVTRSGDSIAFDIRYDLTEHLASVAWTVDGTLSVTQERIEGRVHSHATGSRDATGLRWDMGVDYRAIMLDAQGCPIGGALYAVTSYDIPRDHAGGGPSSVEVEGTVAFGPACQ